MITAPQPFFMFKLHRFESGKVPVIACCPVIAFHKGIAITPTHKAKFKDIVLLNYFPNKASKIKRFLVPLTPVSADYHKKLTVPEDLRTQAPVSYILQGSHKLP